jgi:gas vesicle structural protein
MASTATNRYLERPAPSGLADVVDLILDKGLVIDIYLRVSLIGIEILTVDARIVVASVDTYLRFAEAVNRLNLAETGDSQGLPELMDNVTSGAAKSKSKGALDAAKEKFEEAFTSDEEEEEEEEERPRRRREKQPARRKRQQEDES